MRVPFAHIVLILFVSLLLGGLVNLVHSNRIPWIQDWDSYVESKARSAGIEVISWSFAREQFRKSVAEVENGPAHG